MSVPYSSAAGEQPFPSPCAATNAGVYADILPETPDECVVRLYELSPGDTLNVYGVVTGSVGSFLIASSIPEATVLGAPFSSVQWDPYGQPCNGNDCVNWFEVRGLGAGDGVCAGPHSPAHGRTRTPSAFHLFGAADAHRHQLGRVQLRGQLAQPQPRVLARPLRRAQLP